MLALEVSGEQYNKAEHNRRLQRLLTDRSSQAIEFKHANISAVLIDLGLPYIAGYKPRSNYQQLLREEVEQRLQAAPDLFTAVQKLVEAPASEIPALANLDDVFVPIPMRERKEHTYERPVPKPRIPQRVNYLEREARNSSLGLAGERFVVELEHRRLWERGFRRLAERIDHVSQSRGDGLGYDVLSFESDGREKLIEVKTTRFGAHTPFFVSSNEVDVSEEQSGKYSLYRVFSFRERPKLFVVPGSLRGALDLQPVQYRASVA